MEGEREEKKERKRDREGVSEGGREREREGVWTVGGAPGPGNKVGDI